MRCARRCAVLCAVALGACSPAPEAPEAPRRVIWLTIDALRADHVHFLGYDRETTPLLNDVAKASVSFRRAFAPSSTTFPSVPAYMTGQPPSDFFVEPSEFATLPDALETLPEVFQEADFSTWWFTANGNTSEYRNLDQGVDHFHYLRPASEVDVSIEELTDFIEYTYEPSGGREFIYLHTMDVHEPYSPPFPYDRDFTGGYDRAVIREGRAWTDYRERLSITGPTVSEDHDLRDEDIDFLVSQYDGAIRYTDGHLPALLEALGYDPAEDLLIITADHGEQFYEQNGWGHGLSMGPYEFHVPLLIRWDGFEAAEHVEPVTLLDLYPTLCALYGLPVKAEARGVNLLPVLRGEAALPAERTVVFEGREDLIGPSAGTASASRMYSFFTDPRRFHPNARWPFSESVYGEAGPSGYGIENRISEDPALANGLNDFIRTERPYFEAFTRAALAKPDGDGFAGPNILGSPVRFGEEAPENSDTTTVVNVPRGIRYPGEVVAAGAYHALALDYGLQSGELHVRVLQGDETLCSVAFRKPREGRVPVHRLVVPRAGAIRVEALVSPGGSAEVWDVSLRSLEAKPIAPLGAERVTGETGEGEMSEAERARLEALGYLQ